MKRAVFSAGFAAFGLLGCAGTVPMSENINGFVMSGIRTNNAVTVMYDFHSLVTDGETKFYAKGRGKAAGGHAAAVVAESAALEKMLADYMGAKFANVSPGGSVRIRVVLQHFWLETSRPGAGNMNTVYTASVKVLVTVEKDGQEYAKTLQTSSDGVRTGRGAGRNSWENVVGRIINDANNKALMLLNACFEELRL